MLFVSVKDIFFCKCKIGEEIGFQDVGRMCDLCKIMYLIIKIC